VEITNPFHMGIYTVTRGQFRAFVDATGYKTEAEKGTGGAGGYDAATKKLDYGNKYSWKFTGFDQNDNHPVVNVSWNDAKGFCKWLSAKTGYDVALPTEAQWEYACRAGKTTRYFTGNAEASLEGFANVADQTAKATFSDWTWAVAFRDGYTFTAPVGSFKPNPWDLYDMHGNVWQWCEDWWGADFYKEPQAKTDPSGPASGISRVLRGGTWRIYPWLCRAAYRSGGEPDERSSSMGFRVVLRFAHRTP
jgi:formylglycine-generating enzyme required for sulfatase activity